MAMMEYKTRDVNNEDEASTIEFWSRFGWTLKSSQRVYNKDTHLESSGNGLRSVTETTDFTRLVFERDKGMPNYSQIAELENRYLTLLSQRPIEPKMNGTEGILLVFLLLMGVVPGIVYFVYLIKKQVKAKEVYSTEFAAWEEKMKKECTEINSKLAVLI